MNEHENKMGCQGSCQEWLFRLKTCFLNFLQCFLIFFVLPNPKTLWGFAPGADFAESLKQVAPGAEVALGAEVAPLVFQTSHHPWLELKLSLSCSHISYE